MAEVADLPTEEEVDKMGILQLYLPLRNVGLTDAEVGKLSENDAKAELKRRIRDIQATAAERRRAGQAADNMTEVLEKNNLKQKRLKDLCHSIAAYLPNLDDAIKDQLKTRFDHEAGDILKEVQSHLDKEECFLLVAGETSSGKSTFLNLLLGDKVLPVAFESSTSAICEVKYGMTKQAVVHLREPNDQGQKQITIPLDGTEEHQAELRSYMHLKGAYRDQLPPAKKVEIFWPLPLLEGGIVIVDSPGVGESDMMDKVVADYIPNAFAFLYIINSANAGGVQHDRLGKLLKLYAEKENVFNSESAMFICNKWDLVEAEAPAKEQEEMKTNTFRKLSQMWPDLKESQVFYVSTKKERQILKLNLTMMLTVWHLAYLYVVIG
ncbi:bacterial dynamin-like protein [Branchiostoma floridae]|uniref:Bacterial dynamin-like protein n=1 Tax=Branchiostoma floridae TaxID=7739 RepID=A0A9J7HTV1_BRAFL|nr:bacterial dynamin-like protein [Branchiostoma floridae]